MMPLRALVVDDELNARRKLRQFIEDEPDIELVGEFANSTGAVEGIRTLRPDLLFLDIRLRSSTAFDIVRALEPDPLPNTIFVTAYDEHAARAFELDAIDYLVKPYDRERFSSAVQRARSRIAAARAAAEPPARAGSAPAPAAAPAGSTSAPAAAPAPLRWLLVRRVNGDSVLLATRDIEWIAAAGNYVRIHIGGQSHLHRLPISALADQLDPQQFLRVHRSAVVNVRSIERIAPLAGGDCDIRLRSGTQVRLSRHYRPAFEHTIGRI